MLVIYIIEKWLIFIHKDLIYKKGKKGRFKSHFSCLIFFISHKYSFLSSIPLTHASIHSFIHLSIYVIQQIVFICWTPIQHGRDATVALSTALRTYDCQTTDVCPTWEEGQKYWCIDTSGSNPELMVNSWRWIPPQHFTLQMGQLGSTQITVSQWSPVG